jgi:hypothetical protein
MKPRSSTFDLRCTSIIPNCVFSKERYVPCLELSLMPSKAMLNKHIVMNAIVLNVKVILIDHSCLFIISNVEIKVDPPSQVY